VPPSPSEGVESDVASHALLAAGLVEFRSVLSAVRSLIQARDLRLLDFFRACDFNRDGRLSCSEFAGGLEWV
jgi:hypothetical protein